MAKRLAASLAAALALLAGAVSLQAEKRVFLGERVVTNRTDHVVIAVGGNDSYRKIQFETRRAGVELLDLEVHYEGGGVQDTDVRSFIEPGSWSREIDLDGGQRRIEKVTFTCKASPKGKRRAVVRLYGIK